MNTLKKLTMVALSLAAFGVAQAQEQDGLVPVQSLPSKAQGFIKQHFSLEGVVSVWQDIERGKVEDYTILFADGNEVEFDAKGEWEEVKSRNGAVSDKIVPAKIAKYVKSNYPNALIKKISKNSYKYEVELSNGLELEFKLNGKFVKVDD